MLKKATIRAGYGLYQAGNANVGRGRVIPGYAANRMPSAQPRGQTRIKLTGAIFARARPETSDVSHRRSNAVAADGDGRRFERPVLLLIGGSENFGARPEFALVGRHKGHDGRVLRDHDLLLSVLVFQPDLVALHALYHLRDRGIGHSAVRRQVPWTMAFAGAAHGLRENMDFHRLLAAVGLRHAGDPDERILLDIR